MTKEFSKHQKTAIFDRNRAIIRLKMEEQIDNNVIIDEAILKLLA